MARPGEEFPDAPPPVDLDELWPRFGPALSERPGRSGRPGRPGRSATSARRRDQRRGALSRPEIVSAAIAVADAEGAAAVNMRRIAQELGVGAMSLYWHIDDKHHLLELMLDAVEGEDAVAGPSGDWREDLARLARQQRQSLLRHPWVVDFIGGRPTLGPHIVSSLEHSLALLDDLQLDARTGVDVLSTVATYVFGAVLRELREMRDQLDADEEIRRAAMEEWQQRLRDTGRFSRFLRIFDEGVDPDSPDTRDERFEFGLACVLDGIAVQLDRRAPERPRRRGRT